MPRCRLLIEYDGTPYCGWQRQENGWSVQAAIEKAAEGLVGGPVTLFGAGRTDTGVHATGQVAHLDLPKVWPTRAVAEAINANLLRQKEAVAVLAADYVEETFDARFSALARHYSYLIHQRRAPLTVNSTRAWWVKSELDIDAMNRAAATLVGHHDFTTYRSVDCQARDPIKTLDALKVRERPALPGDTWRTIEVYAYARSFLHNQVRSLVGVLKLVGHGRWSETRPYEALMARDRAACGMVAPSCGLYLTQVDYETTAPKF